MALATDILTLAEARTALNQGITQTANDTVITYLVSALSQRLDDSEDGVGPVIIRDIGQESYDGEGVAIQLDSWPVHSVSAVSEDGTTLTSTQYHIDTEKGLLYRQDGDYDEPWCVGRDNVLVTYRAGRYASTVTVPERYKHGARLFLKHLWRAEQWSEASLGDFDVPQVSFPGFAVPNAVREWFGGEWRGMKGGFA